MLKNIIKQMNTMKLQQNSLVPSRISESNSNKQTIQGISNGISTQKHNESYQYIRVQGNNSQMSQIQQENTQNRYQREFKNQSPMSIISSHVSAQQNSKHRSKLFQSQRPKGLFQDSEKSLTKIKNNQQRPQIVSPINTFYDPKQQTSPRNVQKLLSINQFKQLISPLKVEYKPRDKQIPLKNKEITNVNDLIDISGSQEIRKSQEYLIQNLGKTERHNKIQYKQIIMDSKDVVRHQLTLKKDKSNFSQTVDMTLSGSSQESESAILTPLKSFGHKVQNIAVIPLPLFTPVTKIASQVETPMIEKQLLISPQNQRQVTGPIYMSTELNSMQMTSQKQNKASMHLQKLYNNVMRTGVTKYEPSKQNITEFLTQVLHKQIHLSKNHSVPKRGQPNPNNLMETNRYQKASIQDQTSDRFSFQYHMSNGGPQDPHRIINNIRANIATMDKKSGESRQVVVSNQNSFNKRNTGQLQSPIDQHRYTQSNFQFIQTKSGGSFLAQTNYIGGFLNQTQTNYSPIMAERKVLMNRDRSPQHQFINEQNMLSHQRKQSKTHLHRDDDYESHGDSMILHGGKGLKVMLPKLVGNYSHDKQLNNSESNNNIDAWNSTNLRQSSNMNYQVEPHQI